MSLIYFFIFKMIMIPSLSSELEINKFIKNPTIDDYFQLEEIIRQKVSKMNDEEIKKMDRPNLFINTIKVYYTHLLPKKLKGRNIYLSCFSELYHLRNSLREKKIKEIKNNLGYYSKCISYQYKQNLPPDFLKLFTALEKIK